MNLERPLGPMRLRAWGLLFNLLANVLALYGLSRVLGEKPGGWLLLVVGALLTLVCLLVLARPAAGGDS
ncbi:MAG: hypothetical protein AAGK22_02930 [Acidobacteriota bacterium]